MSVVSELGPLVGGFLARQRWFAGSEDQATAATPVVTEVVASGPPDLVWALVEAGGATYQVLIGLRPEEEALALLHGQEAAVLGSIGSGDVAYDALVDPDLAMTVLGLVTGGAEAAERVRPIGAEQSNSSLVYDDRIILKVFRRLQAGPNPDVEVSLALDEVGFNHVAAPAGHWRRDDLDLDLAIAQEFLNGGSEGWNLALTSLRDLYARAEEEGEAPPASPAELAAAAGGDFGAEARRLGEMTARLHVALAKALGEEPGRPGEWAEDLAAQLERARAALESAPAGSLGEEAAGEDVGETLAELMSGSGAGAAAELVGRLRALASPGAAIRVHGDYHLGQVMRTDLGWFVLDFEGEPARPLPERRRRRSPLRDVAGMLRSLDYATALALKERGDGERVVSSGLDVGWRERNRASFLQGYLSTPDLAPLLPDPGHDLEVLLKALELEKAAYELAYELAYRPAWADIPARALARALGGMTG